MRIARFFGKGRAAQEKPRGEDETKSRCVPDMVAGTTSDVAATGPRIEATDAPASLARSSVDAAAPATVSPAPIAVAVAVAFAPDPVSEPSDEEIAARAYDLWLSQGRPGGRERDNWIEAEQQLRAERAMG